MIAVREYQPKDLARVLEISRNEFADPPPDKWTEGELANGRTWVVTDYETVCGFIIGKIKNGLPYVSQLAIDKRYQKLGMGKRLLQAFETGYAEGYENGLEQWLKVDASNPAQKLYFDAGYRIRSIDYDFYGFGKHALCMYKSIVR